MDEITNKTLIVLLVVAIGVSVLGIWVSVSKEPTYLTAAATSDQGTAIVQISSLLSGYFSVNSFNSTLSITDDLATNVLFNTNGTCLPSGNCTIEVGYLTFENNGNVNASVNVTSSPNASVVFQTLNGPINLITVENAGSCQGTLTTSVQLDNTTQRTVCTNLDSTDNADNLSMYVQANISTAEPEGGKSFTLTASITQA